MSHFFKAVEAERSPPPLGRTPGSIRSHRPDVKRTAHGLNRPWIHGLLHVMDDMPGAQQP
jgi:hypothetical protein